MNHSSITNKLHVNVSITDHTDCPATHTARVTWSAANPHSATQCAAAAMQWQAQATLETPLSCLWPPLTKLAHAGSKEPPALITTHWPVGHIHYHWPAMASDITPGPMLTTSTNARGNKARKESLCTKFIAQYGRRGIRGRK